MLNADECWAQVARREVQADGAFFYGVATTGVFCRPSCAARLANRANVRFFETAEAAEATGLRACLRCRPLELARERVLVERVCEHIKAHVDERLPLARLARSVGLSPAHLQKAFSAAMGVSPKTYHDALRLDALKGRLKDQDAIAGAIFEVGYGSTSRVYEALDTGLGMTPSAYRAGGAGETIVYAWRDTVLGAMMMAATARGVCFVQFGDEPDALLARLRAEYPNAELLAASETIKPELDAWMAALDAHLRAGQPRPDLPLDLRGTAFQLRVWRFLQSVKEGEAISYSELAQGIGAPKAVRAAASACARNSIAVLVPCHRVLRGDGALGGYRWGLERKRALLDAERARAAMNAAS